MFGYFSISALAALGGGYALNVVAGVDGASSLGAVAGAAVVALGHRWTFSPRETLQMLDATAPAGLLALAAARVGCLMQGCDVGAATSVSWAVHYAPGHPAAVWHELGGGMGLHPFPLYLAVPSTVLAISASLLRFERPGSRALVVAVGYALVRGIAEGFRVWERVPPSAWIGTAVAVAFLALLIRWYRTGR